MLGLFGDSGASAFFGGTALLCHFFIFGGFIMQDYKEIYIRLFARVADATDALELGNAEKALSILIDAQQEAEQAVLEMDEA